MSVAGRAAASLALLCSLQVPSRVAAAPDQRARTGTAPVVLAHVVGIAQDGGLPHLGCARECCEAARRDPTRALRVASLALTVDVAGEPRRLYLIDAGPDFRSQVDSALGASGRGERPPGLPLDGILLTHAHIGHYAGLIYLGRESAATTRVPVYATARMSAFLSSSAPWRRLTQGGNIELKTLEPGRSVDLAPGLSVEPLRVPHRDEEADTVGFLVRGPSRRLLYIPDIDAWDKWAMVENGGTDIARLAGSVDVSLLDGTFYSADELPGRPQAEVPHPPIAASMDRLEAVARAGHRILFTHLNHTNPALRPGSPERTAIERRGFEVASEGLVLPL